MKPDIQIIPKLWTTIPEAIRNRVGREPGPQRAMLEEGHLLIILHQLPGPDDASRRPALFWRLPDGSWKSQPDAGGVLALQNHLAAFAALLDELDKAEHAAQTAAEYHKVLEAIAPVLRSSRGLHRALQQAREFVKADRDLINLRNSAASIEHYVQSCWRSAAQLQWDHFLNRSLSGPHHARRCVFIGSTLHSITAFLPINRFSNTT